MEKRVTIAIGLSIIILFLWSGYVLKFYHIENKEVRKEIPKTISPEALEIKEEVKRFSTERFDLGISSILGAIKEVYLKDYKYKFFLEEGFSLREQDKALIFKPIFKEKEVIFSYEDGEKEIVKVLNFSKDKNFIELELKIRNLSDRDLNLKLFFSLLSLNLKERREESRFWEVVLFKSDKILRQSPLKIKKELVYKEDIQVIGFRDRYFCILLRPEERINSLLMRRGEKRIDFILPIEISLPPYHQDSRNFLLYLGPQDKKILKPIDPRFVEIIYFGFFDPISKFLLWFLEVLHQVCRNWGLAIIFLTFFIFLLFYPLTLKQLRSTKEIQALQPQINNLRHLYKDNPQRLNREIMELYRKNKVNPFAGCLPLFLQIPIFFALYQGLIRSFDLRGAKFLWIEDLSQPDKAFTFLGRDINILPILMVLAIFFQQNLSSFGLTKEQREQQRMMNIFFPLLFGFIFYNLPSGLVLYWFTHTLFTIFFQFRILKISQGV
jgi:YidC/Oxa1 family membrane protein insertase